MNCTRRIEKRRETKKNDRKFWCDLYKRQEPIFFLTLINFQFSSNQLIAR